MNNYQLLKEEPVPWRLWDYQKSH